jgi:hypothetical protein
MACSVTKSGLMRCIFTVRFETVGSKRSAIAEAHNQRSRSRREEALAEIGKQKLGNLTQWSRGFALHGPRMWTGRGFGPG